MIELNSHDLCYQDQNGDYVVPEEYALRLEQKVSQLEKAIVGWWHAGNLDEKEETVKETLNWSPPHE